MRLRCYYCGKSVSTDVSDDTVVRAILECPECIEKQPDVDALRQQLAAEQERADHWMSESQRLLHLLEAERGKRCGTCADWGNDPRSTRPLRACVSDTSPCGSLVHLWPVSFGCPHWRGKGER